MNPAFMSKTPGPVAISPFTCQVGVKVPFGQTVSKWQSKTIFGCLDPHQNTGLPFSVMFSALIFKT